MKYLLNRNEIILINEKAVAWDKSALGILTGAILSPFSWLAGSIKTGIKKSQLNGLSLQWGLEYVKALEAMDKKTEVQQSETDDEEEEDVAAVAPTQPATPADDFVITDDNKQEIIDELKKEQVYFNSLNTAIKSMTTWSVVNNEAGYAAVKKSLTDIIEIESSALVNIVPKIDAKYSDTPNNLETAIGFVNAIKKETIDGFLNKYKINVPKDANGRKDALKNQLVSTIADFTGIDNACKAAIKYVTDFVPGTGTTSADVNLKVGNEYIHTDKSKKQVKVKLLSIDHSLKAGDDKTFLTDDDIAGAALGNDIVYVAVPGKNTGFAVNKKNLSEPTNASAKSMRDMTNMILEKSAFKIPKNVEELMSSDDLKDYEAIENIKTLTYPKINLKRLDSIKYEANYILEKSKDEKSKEKNADLLRVWEMGIKNVNDHFQNVINVDKVMTDVKGVVSGKTEDIVKSNQEKMTKLEKLGISETVPDGSKFNTKKLYAFECTVTGQNNKAENMILMMSPTAEFIETIDNKTYYWFKLLGGYDYDLKSDKIVRKNIFANLTQNKKIIDNFNNIENAYYVVLTNLRANPKAFYFEVYSSKGKFFYNLKVYNDVDEVKDDINSRKLPKFIDTRKQISNISNFFRIKINQRFLIDDANVQANKYPGVQLKDLTSDLGFDAAKANHDKFMALIK